MLFVQFYQKSAISDEIIEASGDRSVIILDARRHHFNNEAIAESECKKRGYLAWKLFHGRSLLDCRPVSVKIPPSYVIRI